MCLVMGSCERDCGYKLWCCGRCWWLLIVKNEYLVGRWLVTLIVQSVLSVHFYFILYINSISVIIIHLLLRDPLRVIPICFCDNHSRISDSVSFP